eukprot:4622549-Amphidinium_carterae.1
MLGPGLLDVLGLVGLLLRPLGGVGTETAAAKYLAGHLANCFGVVNLDEVTSKCLVEVLEKRVDKLVTQDAVVRFSDILAAHTLFLL